MALLNIHNYLNTKGSPKEIIDKIINEIPKRKDIGFAGYLDKKWLKMTLERLIPDKKGHNQSYSYKKINEKYIKSSCKEVIEKCKKYLDKKVHIFLFPTFDKFALEKMNGLSGFYSWRDTILLFINSNGKWEDYFKGTVAHEIAHSLSPYCKPGASIRDWIILEGIAENFKEFILKNSKKTPWIKSISKEESKKLFDKMKGSIKKSNPKEYNEIFYGTGKYPLWAGYAIGYYLVKEFIEKQDNLDWNKLLKINPKEIYYSEN